MNVGQMVDQVYTHLQDSTRSYIREDSVISWLNEALLDLDARYRWTKNRASGTFASGSIILPTDLVQIETLHVGSEIDNVQFLSDEDFGLVSYNTADVPFSVARVYQSVIEVYPQPSATTTWDLQYVAEPALLDTNTDIPKLPTVLHRKMVLYAASEALYQEGNMTLGQMKRSDYEQGLPPPPATVLRQEPEIMTVTFARGPFDTHDAKHI